jgi:hypothetical protein
MTTLWGYYNLSRVLTFDYAGFRQRSLSSRRFGLRLRGGSGLLSGRRGFFFRHRCRGFIPLPGQIRRLPAEHTSRLAAAACTVWRFLAKIYWEWLLLPWVKNPKGFGFYL